MSSFSNEQIKKAVDLYFKYNSKIENVRCELGYPERHTLKKWVDYYKSTGKYFQSKQRETSPYSKTQKKIAVDFYIKNGKCMKDTIKALGYSRKIHTLHDWIKELAPSELRIVKVSENVLKYPKKQKEQAIIDLLTTNDSVTGAAEKVVRLSHPTDSIVYNYRIDKLLVPYIGGKEINWMSNITWRSDYWSHSHTFSSTTYDDFIMLSTKSGYKSWKSANRIQPE